MFFSRAHLATVGQLCCAARDETETTRMYFRRRSWARLADDAGWPMSFHLTDERQYRAVISRVTIGRWI